MKSAREKSEIIIVGAGPGGLFCAIELSRNGWSCKVVEKNAVIGPKVCAGGLTGKDLTLGIPQSIVDKSFKKVFIHTPLQTATIAEEKPFIYTVDRKKLGQWLKKEAQARGIKIIEDEVVDVEKEKKTLVLKSGKKFKYDYLVGADGSNSIIRQKLNLPRQKVLAAYQYLVKKVYPQMELFGDIAKIGPWYIWIFPHADYTSMGTCCDPKIFPIERNKKYFEKWLKQKNVDLRQSEYQSWMINYDFVGFDFGRILLVGDAAGFASGLTGEGMYFAMVSGIEVARKIINPNYTCPGIKKILKMKKLHEVLLRPLESNKTIGEIEHELAGLVVKSKMLDNFIVKNFF